MILRSPNFLSLSYVMSLFFKINVTSNNCSKLRYNNLFKNIFIINNIYIIDM